MTCTGKKVSELEVGSGGNKCLFLIGLPCISRRIYHVSLSPRRRQKSIFFGESDDEDEDGGDKEEDAEAEEKAFTENQKSKDATVHFPWPPCLHA